MPTADATLLPPAYDDDPAACDDRSNRHLEEVGAHAVLGAMLQAKKRHGCRSIPAAIELDESALEFDHDDVQRPPRQPAVSEVFLKAR